MTLATRPLALLTASCLALLTACGGAAEDTSATGVPSATVTATAAPPATSVPDDATSTTAAGEAGGTRTATATQTEDPTGTEDATGTADATATQTEDAAGDEEEQAGAPLPEGTMTALLIGSDSRDGDLGGMSDVIVVAQLSADRDHLSLVSVARDSYVDVPGVGRTKVNEAFARGGIPLLRQTVSQMLGGLEIDVVAQTNFEMFIALTRWMDGFWVENAHASTVTVESTGRQVVFPEGRIRLENTDGLIYVRERQSMPLGDLDRTERHRAALVGMMQRLVEIREQDPASLVELLPMLHQNVKVEGDLHLDQLLTLVEVGAGLDPDDVTSLMVPVSSFGTSPAGASVNLLDEGRLADLAQGLREGDLAAYVEQHGTSYAPTGG